MQGRLQTLETQGLAAGRGLRDLLWEATLKSHRKLLEIEP